MFSCTPDVPCIIPINRQWNNESICNIIWEKVARKLAMVEADLERAEERAEQGEKYVTSPDLNIYCSNCLKPVFMCLITKTMLKLPQQPNLIKNPKSIYTFAFPPVEFKIWFCSCYFLAS